MANFGVQIFPTDQTIQPIDLATAVEERGFDSLFFPEHTHIPVARQTPFPGGGDLPDHYWRSHDPFVALTAAAAVTDRIKVGTGIIQMTTRAPTMTAMTAITLQQMSGGRFILGLGPSISSSALITGSTSGMPAPVVRSTMAESSDASGYPAFSFRRNRSSCASGSA